MLVGDLIYNDDFDCNCNYEVYDCTEDGVLWDEGAEIVHSTMDGNFRRKPLDKVLDMEIKYITTNVEYASIVIEARRRK